MRMVARLPEGIPQQFRKTLWLNLAEKHLASRGVQWPQVEEFCFNEFTNPDDEELGVQIVKDVHRTGCSLFCGVSGKDNQALLKRVLLAYARWNKAVGYCQGFNMLAALILQVMDKSEVDSVKVMIYLIEGVLPESYFANNLRGLSVDMAVFRDLLRIKLPALSRHFDQLQCDSKDSGTSYEPPLTNVFTMQWFLTLFCNCLPQDTVLRVWDLIFLEGNHILLSTALAIWSTLSDRIMTVESADEFYCIMGVLTREMLEFGLMDANALIKAIVSFTLPELPELREKYLYNITPWTQSVSTVARRGLRLFYSDDDTDTEEDDEKIAIATAYGLFRSPKRKDGASGVTSPPRALSCPDKEKIAMDISALTKQYRKLRERQKQAHVILTAACGSQSLVGPTTSPAMNHLLMGKFALVNNKGRRLGPPPGSIPPPSQPRNRPGEKQTITISGETLHWKDAMDGKKTQQRDSDEERTHLSPEPRSRRSSSSSTSTELCDDPQRSPSDSDDLSDASAFLPSDTEPSTPKRLVQPKVQHPLDISSCKEEEEEEEAFENTEEDKPIHQTELEVKHKEGSSLSPVSPEGDEDRSQKRKLSFRIDPEELRQLDRKLSLKIVEIERRKSSAGIESEDLNSKVLFPFDRDYIQELEKCDRDTPTSIPDDRMCSSEDYISGFEEETILVPDIITTHKPLGYRMASVEECDETKVNDSYDDRDDNIPEDLMADGNTGESLYMDHESPEEQYEEEEEEEEEEEAQNNYPGYNFDDLFNNKYTENTMGCVEQNREIGTLHFTADNSNIFERTLTHDQNGTQVTSPSPILPGTSDIIVESSRGISEKCDTKTPSPVNGFYLSDDMKAGIPVTETMDDDCISSEKYFLKHLKSEDSKSQEISSNTNNTNINSFVHKEIPPQKIETCSLSKQQSVVDTLSTAHGISSATCLNMSDSEKALERKLANVLPRMASLSLDSSMPDVAAVASREACINSIREKYANLGQTSKEENEYEDYRLPNFLRSDSKIKSNSATVPEKPVLNLMDVETKEEVSSLTKTEAVNVDSSLTTSEAVNFDTSLTTTEAINVDSSLTTTEAVSLISELQISEQSKAQISKESDTDKAYSNMYQSNLNEKNSNEESLCGSNDIILKEEHTNLKNQEEESDLQTYSYEEVIKRPSSASSNRRGSEVALNLILKENSQILSKIQQQSRRSSEVNIDEISTYERLSRPEPLENRFKTDEEIISLTKAILDIEADSNKLLFQLDDSRHQETVEPYSDNSSVIPSVRDHKVFEPLQVVSSNEILVSNILSLECNEKTDDEVIERIDEKKDILKGSNFIESRELSDLQSLPDICKFNVDPNKSPKHKSAIISTDKFQPYLSSRLSSDDSGVDKNATDHSVKILKEPYNYSKRPPIMSPTTEVDENSPSEVKPLVKYEPSAVEDKPIASMLKSSKETLEYSVNSKLYQNSDFLKIKTKSPDTDNLSDTNEDILKELRALDIKPEEVLEYSDSKIIPITPVTPDESFSIHKIKSPLKSSSKLTSENEKYDFQNSSSDPSSDFRKRFQADYKTSSFDVASSIKTDLYSEERHKPIARSSTTVDDDDSLYLNSYKSHGRLLIEKGELNPYKSLDSDINHLETTRCSDRKSLNTEEESAYDYRKVTSSRVNRSYSEFLADDTRSSNLTKTEPREKTLFKYKSEDYGRSMSPPHYRFSSASPVRKRLDHLPTDSPSPPYSSIARAKSPSPTYYSSSQSPSSRESGFIRSSERLGIDLSYGTSADYKRYPRTESLDLHPVERSTYSKKRAESFDATSSEKLSPDKRSPSSPQKFNPFPIRSSSRQPKELGVKLGLYLPQKSDKSPSKRLT